jgi:hypothetical protein
MNRTRRQQHNQHVQNDLANSDDGLRELLNASVLRGLNSSGHRRRRIIVEYQAKIQLTNNQAESLKSRFNLRFKLEKNNDFLDEFRIIRANFSTYEHYVKIQDGSFKVSIRKPRLVYYYTHSENELVSKSFQPPSYIVIAFRRETNRLRID